jgi:TFIIF-interacting CTD phosphatase-like protein
MHATPTMTAMIKDLTKLGRPIEKLLIVDNSPENYQLQPKNGLFISTWMGDQSDHALRDLGTLLVCKYSFHWINLISFSYGQE